MMEREMTLQLSGEPGRTRIAFLEQGSGDPIVFIHGLASSSRMYDEKVLPCLRGEGLLIALDLPGFGRSPALTQELTVARCADVVEAFLDTLLGLQRPVLVGNSLGATIALMVADRRPNRLKGVVVQGPVIDGRDFTMHELALLKAARAVYKLMPWSGVAIKQMIAPSLLMKLVCWSEILRWNPRGAIIAMDDYLRCDCSAMLAIMEDLTRVDLLATLEQFSVPIIAVDGNEVTYRPIDTLKRIAILLPLGIGTTRIVSGAGHLVPFVKPHQFASFVRSFV